MGQETNGTPAAGEAAPAAAADAPAAPAAAAPAAEKPAAPAKRSATVKVETVVKDGVKTVTFTKPVANPGPKAAKPAPAAGAESGKDTAGKAAASAPAKDGKGSTTAPPTTNGSQQPPPKSSASGQPASSPTDSGKPNDKPGDKQPAQPLSKGFVALLDREAKLTSDQQQLKTEREALQAEYAPFKEAREIGKTSKLKAIEKAFGWTLDDLQGEYIDGLSGSLTPEQIAERTARRVLEEQRTADSKKNEETTKTEQERVNAENWAKIEDVAGKLNAAFAELGDELDEVKHAIDLAGKGIGDGVTPIGIIRWWSKHHEGQLPTDAHAALRAYEAALRESVAARGYAKPAPPAAAAEPSEPVTEERRTGPTVRVKASPTTITSDDGGEVPIRPTVHRKETAIERVNRLVRERAAASAGRN